MRSYVPDVRWLARSWAVFALLWSSTTAQTSDSNAAIAPPALMQMPTPSVGQGDTAAQTWRYAKAYMPLQKIAESVEPYVPVLESRFKELLASANESSRGVHMDQPRVAEAVYRARLSGGDLIDGIARLEIESAANFPCALDLHGCQLPISLPKWILPDGSTREAIVGVSPNGRFVAIVDSADASLEFQWSLAGRRIATNTYQFHFSASKSPRNTLEITLPDNLELSTNLGLLTRKEVSPQSAVWSLVLGSASSAEIVIAPARRDTATAPSAVYAEESHYTIAPYGLEGQTSIEIDVLESAVERLGFVVPKGMEVVGMSLDATEIPATIANSEDGTVSLAVARFSPPLTPGKHSVSIRFLGPAPEGSPWRLPRILPDRFSWRQGTATVTVKPPLQATIVQLAMCRQTANRAMPDASGRERKFEYYSADGSVEMAVARAQSVIHVRSGTTVLLGGPTTTARTVADLRAVAGERFDLPIDIPNGWTIDSVSLDDPTRLDDWNVERSERGRLALHVRLKTPLCRGERLQMEISAHRRRYAQNSAIPARELVVAEFPHQRVDEHLLCVRGLSAFRLEVLDDAKIQWLDPLQLTPRQSNLVVGKRGDYIFRAFTRHGSATPPDRLAFRYTTGTPKWSAEFETLARIRRRSIDETYHIVARSEGASLERLRVTLSPAHPSGIRWFLGDTKRQPLTATQLERSEQFEKWEIVVPKTKDATLEIVGERTLPFLDAITPITSLTAPNAENARTVITVVATNETPDTIRLQSSLPELPLDVAAANSAERVLHRYLVNPQESTEGAVTLFRDQTPVEFAAWIWDQSVRWHVANSGECRGEIRWDIENHGRAEFNVYVPPSVTLRRLRVNGITGATPTPRSDGWATVPLAFGRRETSVELELSWTDRPLGLFGRLELPRVDVSLPVLGLDHRLVLPPAFELIHQPPQLAGDGDWLSRIVGAWRKPNSFDRQQLVAGSSKSNRVEPTAPAMPHEALLPANQQSATYIDHDAIQMVSWLAILVTPLLFQAVRRVRFEWVVIWLTLSLTLMLLCPLAFLGIPRSMFWGGVFGCLLRRFPIGVHQLPSLPGTAVGRPATATFLLILVLLSTATSPRGTIHAQPPSSTTNLTQGELPAVQLNDPSSREDANIFQVLVPIGKDLKVTSDYVYVPAKMYEQLVIAESRSRTVMDQWLTKSVRYRGKLSQDADDQSMGVELLDTMVRLQSFRAGQYIDLPIPGIDSADIVGDIRLDGDTIAWEYLASLQGIRFRATRDGEQRLQFSLRPRQGSMGRDYGFDLPLLGNPNTRLELSLARDDVMPRVVNARGHSLPIDENRRSMICLGAAKVAQIRWPKSVTPAASDAGEGVPAVRQVAWVQVDPGVVTFDLRWVPLSPSDRMPRQLTINLPSNFEPIATSNATEPYETIESNSNRRTLRIEPRDDHAPFHLRLLAAGRTGIGELRIPELQINGVRVESQWWGCSVNAALSYERITGRDFPSAPMDAFCDIWQTSRQPDFVIEPQRNDVSWIMRTYPRRTTSIADTHSTYTLSSGAINLRLSAVIAPIEGQYFGHRISLPKGVQVLSIDVFSSQGEGMATRWSRDDDGIVHVQLDGPIADSHRVELAASLSRNNSSSAALPFAELLDSRVAAREIVVRRTTEIDAEIESTENLQLINHDLPPNPGSKWFPIASFLCDSDLVPSATVRIEPNHPEITGNVLTTLRQEDNRWWAEVTVACDFGGGVPDEFAFDVSPAWGDSLRTQPNTATACRDLPDGRRRLTLRPLISRDATSYQFQIEGPIAGVPNVTSPLVIPVSGGSFSRYLALPTRLQQKAITWNVVRARLVRTLPAEFAGRVSPSSRLYELLSPASQAVLERLHAVTSPPRVLLHEVMQRLGDEQSVGLTTMTVDPAGNRSVILDAPPSCEMIATLIDGRYRPIRDLGNNRYELDLVPNSLSAQLQFVTRSDGTKGQTRLRLADRVLRLQNARVRSTIWQIGADRGLVLPENADIRTLSLGEIRQTRLRAALDALRPRAEGLSDQTPSEMNAWYQRWKNHIEGMLREDEPLRTISRSHREEVVAELASLAEQFEVVPPETAPMGNPPQDTELPPTPGPIPVTRFATVLDAEGAELEWSAQDVASKRSTRYILAALAVLLGSAMLIIPRYLPRLAQHITMFLRISALRWTPLGVTVSGCIALCALQPAVIGWCLIAVGIYLAFAWTHD